MKKIDIHIHTLKKQADDAKIRVPSPTEFTQTIFPDMNVDKAIILPIAMGDEENLHTLEDIYKTANEEAYQLTQEYPNDFHWFCAIDPRIGGNSPTTNLSEMIMNYKELGARGVGEMYANLYFDDPFMENLLFHCQQCEMPILFHMAASVDKNNYGLADDIGLPRLEKMLKKFPNLPFIGHSQIFWSEISQNVMEENRGEYPSGAITPGRVVELLRTSPNLYADLSAGSGYNALNRDHNFAYGFLEEFQDRLMFGSDYLIPREGIDLHQFLDNAVQNGHISQTAYEKIICKNARKLLNL